MPNSLPGYAGQILRVNLTSGTVTTTPTSNYVPTYIGGRGIATRIYWEDVPPNVGAFDPANEVIFMTGPVQGTPYTGGGRWVVVGKAPLAFPLEHISASKAGGYAAAELKFAGFDGIVVSGASATPVYLWIHDGSCEILDASGLWGLDTRQTFSMLQQIHGTNAKAISIGQAGEHWSRMASIVSDTKPAFGKGGFGGVMGSKNLKAICISGTGSVEIANPTNFSHSDS